MCNICDEKREISYINCDYMSSINKCKLHKHIILFYKVKKIKAMTKIKRFINNYVIPYLYRPKGNIYNRIESHFYELSNIK